MKREVWLIVPDEPTSGNKVHVQPHRENGVWVCRRWRFVCDICSGPTACVWPTPGAAADHALLHLLVAHGIRTTVPSPARAT